MNETPAKGLVIVLLVYMLSCTVTAYNVYVGGSSSSCGTTSVISVNDDEDIDIIWDGEIFPAYCNFTFKARDDRKLCVRQAAFNVQDCDVYIQYFFREESILKDKSKIYDCTDKVHEDNEVCGDINQDVVVSFMNRQSSTSSSLTGVSDVKLTVFQQNQDDKFPTMLIVIVSIAGPLGITLIIFIIMCVCMCVVAKHHNARRAKRTFTNVGQWTFTPNTQVSGYDNRYNTQYGVSTEEYATTKY